MSRNFDPHSLLVSAGRVLSVSALSAHTMSLLSLGAALLPSPLSFLSRHVCCKMWCNTALSYSLCYNTVECGSPLHQRKQINLSFWMLFFASLLSCRYLLRVLHNPCLVSMSPAARGDTPLSVCKWRNLLGFLLFIYVQSLQALCLGVKQWMEEWSMEAPFISI